MTEMCFVAETFRIRPSEFIGGISGYAAYCFDTAAAIYLSHLKKGEKPINNRELNALSFL